MYCYGDNNCQKSSLLSKVENKKRENLYNKWSNASTTKLKIRCFRAEKRMSGYKYR